MHRTIVLLLGISACSCSRATPSAPPAKPVVVDGVTLPPPFATKSAERSPEVIGWPADKAPIAPPGFVVKRFADGLAYPRWLYVLPNGDVLVSEARSGWQKGKSPNRIMLLRDADHDGVAELKTTFAEGLHMPFGMALAGEDLYVANTDGVVRFRYVTGQTKLEGQGQRIVDLSDSGYHGHWTRNVIVDPSGTRLFVSVGSKSNVGEDGMDSEKNRACILTCARDGSGLRVFASGLRNPTGMDFEPKTGALWTAVNERDELGDDLVPDYITSVKEGAFYGWPYAYFGPNEDPRRKGERPDLVAKTVVPDVQMGAHTASLGLAFYRGATFPPEWRGGAFVAQHGSWNRSQLAGYAVVYVPFTDGKARPPRKDFLTGFIANAAQTEVYGRPVGLAQQADGSLLVADDEGKIVWHVQYAARP